MEEKKFDGTKIPAYELIMQANALLKKAGCGIFGEEKSTDQYMQSRFEQSIVVCPFYGKSRSGK